MFESERTQALRAQSVGDGASRVLGSVLDNLPGSQAGLRIRRQLWLNSDDLGAGLAQLDRRSHAADHASSTNRYQDSLNFGKVFQDFQSHGALTRDDFLVVEWWDNHVTVTFGEFFRLSLALPTAAANHDDLGAQGRRRLAFNGRCIVRHYDDSLRAQRPRRISDPLPMITAGISNHAAASILRGKRRDFVVCPAQLKGTDGLQVFGLEIEFAAVGPGSIFAQRGFNQFGAPRDVAQAGLGFPDVVESNHVYFLPAAEWDGFRLR